MGADHRRLRDRRGHPAAQDHNGRMAARAERHRLDRLGGDPCAVSRRGRARTDLVDRRFFTCFRHTLHRAVVAAAVVGKNARASCYGARHGVA